jgi:hypothetical protein
MRDKAVRTDGISETQALMDVAYLKGALDGIVAAKIRLNQLDADLTPGQMRRFSSELLPKIMKKMEREIGEDRTNAARARLHDDKRNMVPNL